MSDNFHYECMGCRTTLEYKADTYSWGMIPTYTVCPQCGLVVSNIGTAVDGTLGFWWYPTRKFPESWRKSAK